MAATTDSKVYVVTGANTGIGLGLVRALLTRPSTTVVASVRNAAAAASLKAATDGVSIGADTALHVMQLDFSAAPDAETVREAFSASSGSTVTHIDVLICNAGCCPPVSPVSQTTAADLRTAFEVNTIAPLMVFQALQPLLVSGQAATPKFIAVSSSIGSIGGMEPVPGGAYGPSKAALNWLTRAIHVQEEASGLVAVALHPGWVKTRAGEFVAKEWGYEAGPPLTVEESVKGMLDVIDNATRETSSGKFVTQTGQILPW